jgi:hypothetical protein
MKRILLALVFLIATAAQAGIEARWTLTFASGGPGEPSIATVVYRLHLVSGALDPIAPFSQHLTIYDIPGLLDDFDQPPDWVPTMQPTGRDTENILMNGRDDLPKYQNVTWTWVGTTRVDAPAELGIFRYRVVFPTPGVRGHLNRFASQTSSNASTLPLYPMELLGRTRGGTPLRD